MNQRLKKIIHQIAKENGTTPQEVKQEMHIAIRAAMQSSDPQAQALWKEIAPDGKEPSIEEFFAILIQIYGSG